MRSCPADQSNLIGDLADLDLAPEDTNASVQSHHYPHHSLPYRGLPAEIRLQIWQLILPSALETKWAHLDVRNSKKEGSHEEADTYVVTESHDDTRFILSTAVALSGQSSRRQYCDQRDFGTQPLPPLSTLFSVFHVNKTVRAEALEISQWIRPHLMLKGVCVAQMQSLLSCLSPCASLKIFEKLTITHHYEDERPCHTDDSKHMGRCPALVLSRQAAVRLRVNKLCLRFFSKYQVKDYDYDFQAIEWNLWPSRLATDAVALFLEGTIQELQLVINYNDYRDEYWHPHPVPWPVERNDALHLGSLSSNQFQQLDIRYFVDGHAFPRTYDDYIGWQKGFVVLIRLKDKPIRESAVVTRITSETNTEC